MEQVNQINKALTKGASLKEDFAIANREFANATNYLSSAPLCIGTMAQLCLISTNRDFPLNDQENEMKFELLDCPNSFRACLYQVTAEVVTAFRQSHSSMDVVSRETVNVKGYLSQAAKILLRGTPIDIEDSFPVVMSRITQVATICEAETELVVDKYNNVIDIIDELVTASYGKLGDTEAKKNKAEYEKELAEMKKMQLEERKKKMEEELMDLKENEKKCQEAFAEAMDDIPSGWGRIGLNFVNGLAETVLGVATVG